MRHSQSKTGIMLIALLCGASILFGSCTRKSSKPPVDRAAYAQELTQWQQKRWADLKSETGWLTLVGLFWLKEGGNKIGSDPHMDIVLPNKNIPQKLGAI